MSKDHKKMSETNSNLDGIICENHVSEHMDNICNSNLEGKKFVSKLLIGSSSSNEIEVIVSSKQQEGKENIGGEGKKKRNLLALEDQPKDKDKAAEKGKSVKHGRCGSLIEHEIHIRMERERRKKMRNMFVDLHALLPQLPPKTDKSTIIDEAVNYIKTLETTLQDLQKKQQEKVQQGTTNEPFVKNKSSEALMIDYQDPPKNNVANFNSMAPRHPMVFETWAYSNVVLNLCGNEAQFSVCSPKKAGILPTICSVFEQHHIEVLSAHITSSSNGYIYMFQAKHGSGDGDELIEPFLLQEIFKKAATEIMYWLSL